MLARIKQRNSISYQRPSVTNESNTSSGLGPDNTQRNSVYIEKWFEVIFTILMIINRQEPTLFENTEMKYSYAINTDTTKVTETGYKPRSASTGPGLR